jgi:acyl-CoA synthetase (AMP-forming)/AMP-acid ligase II
MDFVNSEIFIWCWFGLWAIGAKPAFLNYNLKGEALVHCIRSSGARLVLVDGHGKNKFSEGVMEEHGFVTKTADEKVLEGSSARHGNQSDVNQGPQVVQHRTNDTPLKPTLDTPKLEIILFDKRLENYILSLKAIRQPDSERGNQKRHDMAMLIYTSGTTGLPKAAIMSWNKANVGAQFIRGWINLKNTDVMYTAMPLYHGSASVLGVGTMLIAGGAICLSQKFSHKKFWPEVRASKATIIQYVGETCRYLLSAPADPLDKQHHVRAAFGNGLRPDVWQRFKDRFAIQTIYEFYSATEAPAALFNRSTNAFSAGAFARNGSLGTFIMNTVGIICIRMSPTSPSDPLRDLTTGLCLKTSPNEPGELIFKLDASHIERKFQGYFGNEKASSSKVLRNVLSRGDAWYRSGDLVRCDEEGRWFFVDRLGDTFRWKAENVSTAEVADVLGKHEAVQEANVYGVQVPHYDGRAGCAAIVLKPSSTTTTTSSSPADTPTDKPTLALPDAKTLESLAVLLRKELPPFAVPVWLRLTKEMHTTGTNKQQKQFFRQDGIDVEAVERQGDVLFWLQGKSAGYERFTGRDLERIKGGGVKL